MTVYGIRSFLGSEPPNISFFVGMEADNDGSKTESEQSMQDKPKQQGKELGWQFLTLPINPIQTRPEASNPFIKWV